MPRWRSALLGAVALLALASVVLTLLGTDGPSGVIEERGLRLAQALQGVILVAGVLRSWRTGATAAERAAWLAMALATSAV